MLSPIRDRIRRRVAALLAIRGPSQAELAKQIGISQAHISQMVVGKRAWPIDHLDDLARALKVPTYALLMDDPSQWIGQKDRRRGERRSGADRRLVQQPGWVRSQKES